MVIKSISVNGLARNQCAGRRNERPWLSVTAWVMWTAEIGLSSGQDRCCNSVSSTNPAARVLLSVAVVKCLTQDPLLLNYFLLCKFRLYFPIIVHCVAALCNAFKLDERKRKRLSRVACRVPWYITGLNNTISAMRSIHRQGRQRTCGAL